MKNYLKNFATFLFGWIIALSILEIFLQIYNPFPTNLHWNEIKLPINRNYIYHNDWHNGLDKKIIHTKNSLGFRGQEIPKQSNQYLRILAVGGSTTECRYISKGKDWPILLGKKLSEKIPKFWINNAGFDGHSTYGHQILLDQHLKHIHPNYAIFLIGCNDLARKNSTIDLEILEGGISGKAFPFWRSVFQKSETAVLMINFFRAYIAMDVGHKKKSFFAYEHKIVDDKITAKELNKHQTLLNEYKKRVVKLVKSSRSFGIEPILLTQPTLVGKGKDPITNINLETIEWIKWNGKTYWSMLEKYNKITKEVGTELNVKTIDLAHKLPKNSIYFYDFIHFTNAGSEKVSEILATELIPFLQQQGH